MNNYKAIQMLEYVKTFDEHSSGATNIAINKGIRALNFEIRARELLTACVELLNKQKYAHNVLDLLTETIYYDECECDGDCLLEDIISLLDCGE